jgi:hypothetical protein
MTDNERAIITLILSFAGAVAIAWMLWQMWLMLADM